MTKQQWVHSTEMRDRFFFFFLAFALLGFGLDSFLLRTQVQFVYYYYYYSTRRRKRCSVLGTKQGTKEIKTVVALGNDMRHFATDGSKLSKTKAKASGGS
jgi:hypothetical protein